MHLLTVVLESRRGAVLRERSEAAALVHGCPSKPLVAYQVLLTTS
jgi:hypothetical protein